MKKILILPIGLLIAYPLYYYLGHNNGLLLKIPYCLVAFASYYIFFSGITSRLEGKSYYKGITQLGFAASLILTIITYETFDKLTFGSRKEQANLLAVSQNTAVGRVLEVEHFDSHTIKRKDIPEHWEVKYEFEDSANKTVRGIYQTNVLPTRQAGDTLMIRYVKDSPEINQQIRK